MDEHLEVRVRADPELRGLAGRAAQRAGRVALLAVEVYEVHGPLDLVHDDADAG